MIYGKDNVHPAGDPWKAKQIKLASLSSLHRSSQLPSKSVFSLYIITNVLKSHDIGMTPASLQLWKFPFSFYNFNVFNAALISKWTFTACSHAGLIQRMSVERWPAAILHGIGASGEDWRCRPAAAGWGACSASRPPSGQRPSPCWPRLRQSTQAGMKFFSKK